MQQADAADIVLESIEIFIQHILYVREVYPAQIFKKRRVYNTPIYVSIYPPLNAYLFNILRTARELLLSKELQRLEVLIYRDEFHILERYSCELVQLNEVHNLDDKYLLNYEQELRSALYKLAERLKQLDKLPNDAKFKIMLHTTQIGFVRLSHNAHYQEFPWLQESPHSEPDKQKLALLPLAKVATLGLKLQAEVL